ncbi:hypothetical protein ACFOWE_15510, partial [Planomonospora corallina]
PGPSQGGPAPHPGGGPVHPGGAYSVVARATGREGRKLFGRSAIYEVDGTLVATAKATWITRA